ncbi:MAG: 30S ribosomal protein S2 [Candidatus Cloacimonetes bacterium]|nr:30S ribosomal protein S2 [Candidatus Cloacimonadota bacterium]
MLPRVSIKGLLEAGVHFGHSSSKWDPRMAPYLHTKRNGIHIIDLQKTVKLIVKACTAMKKVSKKGANILFISTKKQASDIVRENAEEAGCYYINSRWLGGTLTNYKTIRQRIAYLKKLERMVENGDMDLLGKKERSKRMKELDKLTRNLNGIRDMEKLPEIVFIVDPNREHIAVDECNKLGIPIVAITDSNCNPDKIQHIIPGNDDAMRAIKIITSYISEAVMEGKEQRKAKQDKEVAN